MLTKTKLLNNRICIKKFFLFAIKNHIYFPLDFFANIVLTNFNFLISNYKIIF